MLIACMGIGVWIFHFGEMTMGFLNNNRKKRLTISLFMGNCKIMGIIG